MDHQAFAQLLGNYGEFLGAIAVFGTLAYLAVQVRQSKLALEANTRSVDESRLLARTDGLRELTRRWDDITRFAYGNPEAASIFLKGCRDLDELDDVEQSVFASQMVPYLNHHLQVLQMAESDFLGDDIVGDDIPAILDDLIGDLLRNNPGARQWWEAWQFGYPHRDHVNALLAQPGDPRRASIGKPIVRKVVDSG
jgi:hypothetical protein